MRRYPDNPDVKYLDALLTEDGNSAAGKYEEIYRDNDSGNYKAEALYNIYSYYYSLGFYNKADAYLSELRTSFPDFATTPSSTYVSGKDVSSIQKPGGANFTIQAGAFLNLKNAENLKDKLTADGFYSDTFPKSIGGTIFNIVIVGKFLTESEAEKKIETINKKYNLKGRVIPFQR